MTKEREIADLMKRCQIGCHSLDDCNDLLAECHGTLGALVDNAQRTTKQNSAMHKYFEILAEALNSAGLEMRKVLKPEVEMPWSKDTVKEFLWRPIQKAMLNKTSTTELDTVNPSEVYNVLSRHLGEKFGIYVDWPSNR